MDHRGSYNGRAGLGNNDGQGIQNETSPSAFHSALPNRRRNRRPLDSIPSLHTSHIRGQPFQNPASSSSSSSSTTNSFVPTLSSPLRESNGVPEPSVFLTPNSLSRKRSHFTAESTNTSSTNSSNSLYYTVPEHQNDRFITNGQSLLSDDSFSSSSSSNRFGSWSRKSGLPPTSHFSEPQMSLPARPPQGEFSFQAQAPSSSSFHNSANDAFNSVSSSTLSDERGETSSMAFARLARSQRQQQEARRVAESGGVGDLTNDVDEYQDGPPVKKRRGMASTIVDGALNAALYTGAAALTAYSLWSSWGRKGDSNEQQQVGEEEAVSSVDEVIKLPPGGMIDEPPPPYTLARGSLNAQSSASPSTNSQRPVHVFVSSRRRRPVFASHRSARNTPRKKAFTAENNFPQDSPSHFMTPQGTSKMNEVYDEEDDEDGDDDDEMFKRFQSRMSSLIEEGTKALHAKADLTGMDLEEDEEISFQSAKISPSKSEPRFNSLHQQQQSQSNTLLPRSQTTSTFTFGNGSLRRPFGEPSRIESSPTTSPRTPFLSLASRDPNSPYGKLSRPSSSFASPTSSSNAKRRL